MWLVLYNFLKSAGCVPAFLFVFGFKKGFLGLLLALLTGFWTSSIIVLVSRELHTL